jgi:hypothetical protein
MVPTIFDSEPKSKVDQAIAELRRAGYEVFHRPRPLDDPPSESLRVIAPSSVSTEDIHEAKNAVVDEIAAIVEKFGGCIYGGTTVGLDHIPFSEDVWSYDR